MFLSDKDLKILAKEYNLVSPFNEENCEGATINLTLDPQVKKDTSQNKRIMGNERKSDEYETIDLNKEDFYLESGKSVLVQSFEYFKIPTNMAAIVLERYSIKLLGLVVSPASYMNPGFEGRLSFLVTNHSSSPIRLVAGVKFSQLAITPLSTESERPYQKQDAKYMGGHDVHISKLHLDREIQEYLKDTGITGITEKESQEMGMKLLEKIDNNTQKYVEMIKHQIGGFNEPVT